MPSLLTAYDAVVGALARGARASSRIARVGAGTSAPGLVVQRLDPGLVGRRSGRLEDGVAVVSGTNGKTTTAAMLGAILAARGRTVLTNESGANLFRGIATALVSAPRDARTGVFEVDEGALRRLVPMLRPNVLVLTNVLRDQLDRFGEPETVARLLGEAARAMPEGSTIVANADDPLLWHAVEDRRPIGFGVRVPEARSSARLDAEPEVCPRCGGPLTYRHRTISHLGSVRCRGCDWASLDAPPFVADIASAPALDSMPLAIGGVRCDLPLGGIHNAYNAAAAVAAASAFGVTPAEALGALKTFAPKFGRTERFEFDGRHLWLLLMKNPAGASVLVDQVLSDARIRAVAILVSDRYADGRDISWIWDADFESLVESGVSIVAGGVRASDVAVRIKYARGSVVGVEPDPRGLLTALSSVTEEGDSVAVLATYTSMLDFRQAVLGSKRARVADLAS